jgi:hypothetical protein
LPPRSSTTPPRAISVTVAAVVTCVTLLIAADAWAHRRDEYLQAARLGIEPDRVRIELDLTPGIAVADKLLEEIDRDRSGTISESEARAYAAAVRRGVTLEVDGQPLEVRLIGSRIPSVESMRIGEGAIRLDLAAAAPSLSDGAHRLRYRNAHHSDIGVYLANALVPDSNRVSVTAQQRDGDQRELTIEFTLRAASALRVLPHLPGLPFEPTVVTAATALAAAIAAFVAGRRAAVSK